MLMPANANAKDLHREPYTFRNFMPLPVNRP
jgi:hypothetical protein